MSFVESNISTTVMPSGTISATVVQSSIPNTFKFVILFETSFVEANIPATVMLSGTISATVKHIG